MGIFMKGLNEEWLKLPVLVRTWGETQLSQEGRQSFAFRTKYWAAVVVSVISEMYAPHENPYMGEYPEF